MASFPDTTITEPEEEPPKTFAFFDIETTGLPEYEYFKTKITELSIVACSKEHIFQTPLNELPRILHKLSICVNPAKRIECQSTEITKIDNYLVENENKFNKNVAILLANFLQHLQQPVCLIAHNGLPFDFPILRRELLRFDLDKLNFPKTLKCVDSLPIFRKIDEEMEVNHSTLKDDDDILANPLNEKVSSPDLTEIDKSKICITPNNDEEQSEKVENLSPKIDDQLDKNSLEYRQKINETTPSINRMKPRLLENNKCHHNRNGGNNESIIRSKVTPKSENCIQKLSQKSPNPIKRKLLDSFNATVSDNGTVRTPQTTILSVAKKKFTLYEIYKRLNMNQEPEISHYAEADTMTLLKCVIQMRDNFFKFINTDSILFSDVKDLGKK